MQLKYRPVKQLLIKKSINLNNDFSTICFLNDVYSFESDSVSDLHTDAYNVKLLHPLSSSLDAVKIHFTVPGIHSTYSCAMTMTMTDSKRINSCP